MKRGGSTAHAENMSNNNRWDSGDSLKSLHGEHKTMQNTYSRMHRASWVTVRYVNIPNSLETQEKRKVACATLKLGYL